MNDLIEKIKSIMLFEEIKSEGGDGHEASVKRIAEFSLKIENRSKDLGVPQLSQKEKNIVESLRHEIKKLVTRPSSNSFHRPYCPLHLDTLKTIKSQISLMELRSHYSSMHSKIKPLPLS